MSRIKIGPHSVVVANYKDFISIEDIFDLESYELCLFLKKKKDAPFGNLREIYHSQSNRGLISKIAREMLFMIIWEILDGKTFYLPHSKTEKIFVSVLNPKVAKLKREYGKFKNLDLYMSDFKIPQIQLYTHKNKRSENVCVYINNELREQMNNKLNSTGKVGGKIPFRLANILPYLYDMFSYIEKDCIKLICETFFRRLKIVAQVGCDLVVKDRHNMVKFYNSMSIYNHEYYAPIKKEAVLIKLKQDKIENFPCHNKQLINLMN